MKWSSIAYGPLYQQSAAPHLSKGIKVRKPINPQGIEAMHLSNLSSFALLFIVVSGTLVTPSHKGVCNPSSRQDNLQKLQQEAIKDYAHIIP